MNVRILNRESKNLPDDGWYQIEVNGEHATGDGRVQVIDATSVSSIVNRFKAARAAEGFAGVLVDVDHLSHEMDQTTEAKGWLQEVRENNGELEGRIEWTDVGLAAVKNKRFKFFSTEYEAEDLEVLGNGRVRPLALGGLALTNRPNNKGGRPITNRKSGDEQNKEQNNDMKEIAKKLGLPEDASEDAILAAIGKLKGEMKEAEETVMNRDKQLKDYQEREADELVEKYSGRIGEDADVKAHFRDQAINNREGTEKILKGMPETSLKSVDTKPLRNRATNPAPIDGESKAEDGEGEQRNLVESIRIKNRCSHGEAWNQAKRERPELFRN